MSMMQSLRAYLRTCPLLAQERLNVDFLEGEAGAYSLESAPGQVILRRYADGSSVRQLPFTLSSRAFYGPDIRRNLDSLGFFEGLSEWLEDQSASGNLPEAGGGRRALAVRALTHGYAYAAETDSARYQIQCALDYFQRRM